MVRVRLSLTFGSKSVHNPPRYGQADRTDTQVIVGLTQSYDVRSCLCRCPYLREPPMPCQHPADLRIRAPASQA